jgi:mono/diheme cytochrome c family protein
MRCRIRFTAKRYLPTLVMNLKRRCAECVTLCSLFFALACEPAQEKIARSSSEAAGRAGDTPFSPDGAAVFRKNCTTCHGASGSLGLNGAKDLQASTLSLEERVSIITEGKKLMTPFGKLLTSEEIKAVAEYTISLKKAAGG